MGSEPGCVTYTTAHGNVGSFNPLSKTRDHTCFLMDTSQVLNPMSHNGNFSSSLLSGKAMGLPKGDSLLKMNFGGYLIPAVLTSVSVPDSSVNF